MRRVDSLEKTLVLGGIGGCREGREPLPDHAGESPLLSRSGGEKGLSADPDEVAVAVSGDGTETVETARGLRQRGVSKENRPQPIVQMGLFLDDQGIPLSIEEFPGNTLDAQTLKDAMRKTVDNFDMGRFILLADRGMYSGTNMLKVIDGGNGYIVAKSLLKSMASERAWRRGRRTGRA